MSGELSRRNFTARFAAAGAVPLLGTAACTAGSDNRAQSPGETTSPTPGAPAGEPWRWSAADLTAAIAARQMSAREATNS